MVAAVLILLLALPYHFWLAALGGYLVRAKPRAAPTSSSCWRAIFSGNRILTAGDLVRQGFAPKALVSGTSGEYGLHESDLAIPFAVRHGYPESYFVALPNDARSTAAEADAVLAALRKLHAHRIDIVTSDYHTRRAGNIYRARLRRISKSIWWPLPTCTSRPTAGGRIAKAARLFCLEWMKTVTTWFGLMRCAR